MKAIDILSQKEPFVNQKGEPRGLIRIIEGIDQIKTKEEKFKTGVYLLFYIFIREALGLELTDNISASNFDELADYAEYHFFDSEYFNRSSISFMLPNSTFTYELKITETRKSHVSRFKIGTWPIAIKESGPASGKNLKRYYSMLAQGNFEREYEQIDGKNTWNILFLLLGLPPCKPIVRKIFSRVDIYDFCMKLAASYAQSDPE